MFLTVEQKDDINETMSMFQGRITELQSLLERIVEATEGVILPEPITAHLEWEEIIKADANWRWRFSDGIDPARRGAKEPDGFLLTVEQKDSLNETLSSFKARIVELESLLEIVSEAIKGMGEGTGGEAAISVAALADAGYTVDMTKATPLLGFVGSAQAAVDHVSDVVPAELRRLPRDGSGGGGPPR